jgi:hypothetical protein
MEQQELASTEQENQVSSAETEVEGGEEELDIDSLIDELDADTQEATPEKLDTESPEFVKLAQDFKTAIGIELKDAIESFQQSQKYLQELQAKVQEMESQRTLADLQDAWDVTPKELDRRVDAVLKVYNKMTPAQQSKYDSVQGVQDLWAKIEGKSSKTAPSAGGKKSATPVKRYKQSEIRKMMMETPELYDQNQQILAQAFRDGLVDLD